MIRAFLDANVFFAATASAQGGSALLLETAKKRLLEIVPSHLALLEAERNIRNKLPAQALKQFHRLLQESPLLIVPASSPEEIHHYHSIINEKDAPILAAAVSSKSDFLITLDRKGFMSEKMRRASLPLKVVTPGDLFRSVLL